MAEISGLSVRVSATTAAFTSGMNRVQDTAADAALSLRRLSFASESAESNLDEVGRSALGASGGMVTLGATTEGAGFAVRGLSASILLSLIPALTTLAAPLVPILAALGGFVAIAGAITGIGMVATIGAIATNTKFLKESFSAVVSTLKDEFAPVFDLTAQALDLLLDRFRDIIPALVPAQGAVEEILGNFVVLGTAIIDALPAFVDLATALTEEFLPGFVTFAQDVLPDVPDMIRSLVDAFRRMLPRFIEAGRLLRRLLPPLLEFGFIVLDTVGPALADLARIGTDAVQLFNRLDSRIQDAGVAVSLLAPVLFTLVSLLGGPVTLAIAGVVAAVVGLHKAWQTNFAGIRDVVSSLGQEVNEVMPEIRAAIDAFTSGIDFKQITNAVQGFEKALGTQLRETVVALGPVFDRFETFLSDNKEEFRLLADVMSDVVSMGIRLATLFVNVLGPAIRTVLVSGLTNLINTLDFVLESFKVTINALRQAQERGFTVPGVDDSLGPIDAGSIPEPPPRSPPSQQRGFSGNLTVTINENTDIVDARIEEGAEAVVSQRERAINRNQGRGTNVRR